ncbi:unnamed protein product, partial [Adineta steineri]
PPPPPPPPSKPTETKENKAKLPPPVASKQRGRLVELKKTTPKTSATNGTPKKLVNVTPIVDPSGSTLVRRASGLKDLIHRFEATPSKSKRTTTDNPSSTETNQDDQSLTHDPSNDEQQQQQQTSANKSKTIDIPDLLQNVEKEPISTS